MTVKFVAIAAACLVAVAQLGAHDGPHNGPSGGTFSVGKKGDVNIREDVKIGNDTLKRGKYLFEHRVEGDRHLIVLTEVVKKDVAPLAYEIPTRVLSVRQAAKRSVLVADELADHSLRVGVIHVAGEALEHFPGGATLLTGTY